MKKLAAGIILLTLSQTAGAIPIYTSLALEGISKALANEPAPIESHWTWRIRAHKYTYVSTPVPVVPEPSTYALLLVGAGLVAWRTRKG